jgi:PAS domain S-box-containing protein
MSFLRRHLSWVTAIVFGLVGPLMGVLAARLAGNVERQRAFAACAEYFAEHQAAFQREVSETTDATYHLASLFLVSNDVSREQFAMFARDMLTRHRGVAALEWAPRVTAEGRAAHEALGRAEGLEGYRIRAQEPGDGLIPEPAASEYYPVFYADPPGPNGRALGFDLFSEPVRRAGLMKALATRKLTLTDPIRLVQDPGSGWSFLALLPVFAASRTGLVPAGDKPEGFVVLVLRARTLLAQILDGAGPRQRAWMRFALSDVGANGRSAVIDATPESVGGRPYVDWQFAKRLEIGGRHWVLTGRPTGAYVSRFLTFGPPILGIGVVVLWELAGGLALLLVARSRDLAFRQQTRIFEIALRSLNEGVVVAEASGRFALFNDTAEAVLGVAPRDMPVSRWSSEYGCFYPDAATPFPSDQLPLARALQGEVSNADVFIRNPHVPHGVLVNISGTPLRDEQGRPDGGVVVFRDITAAKQGEDRLRASLKQLEDLRYAVDQASLVAMTNRAGTIIEVNDKFCEVTGYSREELIGQNHRILKSGYHSESFYRELWRTISSGRVWRQRICNRAKDGRHFWVDTTIVPLLLDGEPDRYLALRTEITEHMRKEAELVRLSNAVEQTADAIMITAPDGTIQYVNPAFEATTGYSRAEAIGQSPRLLRSGKQPREYYDVMWRTILRGQVFRGSPINRRKNGELYQAEQTITPIKDSEGRIEYFVAVIKDVTDRVRVEQQEIEMRYASDVQRRLYPAGPPEFDGLDVAAATFPALATCGDYYDFLALPNGSLGVVIGDVSGHGLGPALIMVETRACLQFLSQEYADPGEVLTRINATLYHDLEEGRYVALILARLDLQHRRLVYANAGHTAAYHLDRLGNVKAVMESGGPPAGMMRDVVYTVTENPPLDDGDIVVFLTDGVTESEDPSGNPFGSDAAIGVIRDHLEASSDDLVRHLRDAARAFAGGAPQQDDITLVVCRMSAANGARVPGV